MARYKYIQRDHAIVTSSTPTDPATEPNPWLTSTTTTETTTTTPAVTTQTTRVETLAEFLARITGDIKYFFSNATGEIYGVIVDNSK